jgi:hypothetical protein
MEVAEVAEGVEVAITTGMGITRIWRGETRTWREQTRMWRK